MPRVLSGSGTWVKNTMVFKMRSGYITSIYKAPNVDWTQLSLFSLINGVAI